MENLEVYHSTPGPEMSWERPKVFSFSLYYTRPALLIIIFHVAEFQISSFESWRFLLKLRENI